MNDAISGKASKREPRTDWRRLRARSDAAVHAGILDDPAAAPTDDAFWTNAQVVMPQRKQSVTIRLDTDLLDWLRRERGYQTRINAILRSYMNAHRS